MTNRITALHRALGMRAGPITDDMITAAVAAKVPESDDLDYKGDLAPVGKFPEGHELIKDIAAMANRFGGVIIYGVTDDKGIPGERMDAGRLTESQVRAIVDIACTAITPSVFGVRVHQPTESGDRAVVIEVPASTDGPHLIYRKEHFAFPMRNGADTRWVGERDLAAAYRARFNAQRHDAQRLAELHDETIQERGLNTTALLVATAVPRRPSGSPMREETTVRAIPGEANRNAQRWVHDGTMGFQPAIPDDPRRGLRRWVYGAPSSVDRNANTLTMLHNGSLSMSARLGGGWFGQRDGRHKGNEVTCSDLERFLVGFFGVVQAVGERIGSDEFDTRIGIVCDPAPVTIMHMQIPPYYSEPVAPNVVFLPVDTTLDLACGPDELHEQVHAIALDCVNQAGISNLAIVRDPHST